MTAPGGGAVVQPPTAARHGRRKLVGDISVMFMLQGLLLPIGIASGIIVAAVPLTLPFRAITTALNLAGRSLDRLTSAAADHTKNSALIANFLVVATR